MTTYTASLRFAQMVPADPAVYNQWGTVWNNTVAVIEQAVTGNSPINIGGQTAVTLTTANNAPDQARQQQWPFTGALTAPCTITIPAVPKMGLATNGTTGNFPITLTTGHGRTITILPGLSSWYTCDGTNVDSPVIAGAIPVGALMAFGGAVVPPRWLFCAGQAVSRTTYALLFAAIGANYGGGDGSTTFNVPDLRGRAVFGSDAMNGTAANRLTVGGSGVGSALGSAGGNELLQNHGHGFSDPGHTHTISDPGHGHGVTDGGHNHVISDPGHAHGISDPAHVHSVYDPAHQHGYELTRLGGGASLPFGSSVDINHPGGGTDYAYTGISLYYAYSGISINGSGTGVYSNSATTAIGINAGYTGITITASATHASVLPIGGGASQNVPPALVVNILIYAGQ
jgi:hypothetical protein